MKRQFALVFCLFLFIGVFSVSINFVKAPSGDGLVEVVLNVRGTFLRAMDDWPYYGPGHYEYDENLELKVGTYTDFRVEDPIIIDLQAESFNEGDKIYISWLGGFYPTGAWNPDNPETTEFGLRENDQVSHGGLLGLFSTTSQIADIDKLNRVSGAIDYGEDYFTPDTWWQDGRPEVAEKLSSKNVEWYTGSMTTDIPEDFKIFPHTGMSVEIPRNARFLFLCLIDPYYRDNYEGPNGLIVTIEKDSDEDGIPDHWEINGIDIDKDGTVDLDLPAMGADWQHKDIFVEVDYMGSSNDHNHRPNPTAISDVIQAFANAPVTNPDSITGINLHVFIDEELPHQNEKSFDEVIAEKVHTFGTAEERSKPKTIEAKELVFHYCVFIHKQKGSSSSGMGEIRGNDFIVSLGAFDGNTGTYQDQAATFMHELGHNLGLLHGGDTNTPNYKPNYVSIMNYLFQFDRRVPDRALDFSVGDKSIIRENVLDENLGIGDLVKTAWWLSNGTLVRSVGALPIDWNADGNITANIQMNLNNNPNNPSADDSEVFTDYNDWANLFYRFRGTASFSSGAEPECHEEITWEEVLAMEEEAKNSIEVPVPESYNPVAEKRSIEIDLSSRGTFLRAEPFQGSPSGGSAVEDPAIVDLVAEGFKEGDYISISYSGTVFTNAYWGGSNELGEYIFPEEEYYLLGLFSASNDLLSVNNLNRVPGAIEYGEDIDTEVTHRQKYETDIQEDFSIKPCTGSTVQVPPNAKYLFIGFDDTFYPDNVGEIRISIQCSDSSVFPIELIIILAVAVCAVVLIILLLSKRKNKKDEKPLEVSDG